MKIIIEAQHTYENQLTIEDIEEGVFQSGFEVSEVLVGSSNNPAVAWAEQNNIPVQIHPIEWENIKGATNVKTNKYGKKYNADAAKNRNSLLCSQADGMILFWWESDNSSSFLIADMKKTKKRIFIPKINPEFEF